MNDFAVALKVVSERNCPYYAIDDLFVLTGQAVQIPIGHPSCLILVREVTNLLFSTFAPSARKLETLVHEIYTCGGCIGLIKFQVVNNSGLSANGAHNAGAGPGKGGGNGNGADPAQDLPDEVSVSGRLSEISPTELLQFFHMHQKTGKLIMDVATGMGKVIFREGAIIGAKFMDMEDKEAVFALLREHRGGFNFVNGIPESLLAAGEIGDFMMLLMEGLKRMDES